MTKDPICVAPTTPINEAVHKMGAAKVGCVLVAEGTKLVGIFTERDLLHMFSESPEVSLHEPVLAHMTAMPLRTIELAHEPVDALCLMIENNIRHLPVLEGGDIVGILGLRDLVKADEIVP